MPDRNGAVAAWSAGVCAAAGVVAGFGQHVLWLFIVAAVIGAAALAISLVAGVPDFVYWVRAQVDRQTAQDLEVIVRRRFAVDWENASTRFVRVEAIIQNNSAANVLPSKIVLRPTNFQGPAKLVGGLLSGTIGPGMTLLCKIQPIDFADILGQTSDSDQSNTPTFLVHVEIGYGSSMRSRDSKPFSLRSKLPQPPADGSSEWTEEGSS